MTAGACGHRKAPLSFIECRACHHVGKRIQGEPDSCRICGGQIKPISSLFYNLKLRNGGENGA